VTQTSPKRTRPELPRLVEQIRALLVFQRYLTVVAILAAFIAAALGENAADQISPYNPEAWDAAHSLPTRLFAVSLGLIPVAIALAVCGKLLWRRWAWVYLLLLIAQAAVVALIVVAVTTGYAAVIPAIIYSVLTVWIIVDMFRPEVLRFFWRKA
jgi:O-antigen ligase